MEIKGLVILPGDGRGALQEDARGQLKPLNLGQELGYNLYSSA